MQSKHGTRRVKNHRLRVDIEMPSAVRRFLLAIKRQGPRLKLHGVGNGP